MNQMLKFTKDEAYEGKVIVMGNTGSNNNSNGQFIAGIIGGIISGIIIGIITLFFTGLGDSDKNLQSSMNEIQTSINGIQTNLVRVEKDIEYLKSDVASLKNDVSSLKNDVIVLENKYERLNDKFANSFQNLKTARLVAPASPYINAIASSIISYKNIVETAKMSLWIDGNEVIATSPDKSVEYTGNDLKNEKVIFTYMEDGEQIIFCGQYSENNRWDGNCIINRYRDGKLTFIMDAEYNDGVLLNYKYVFTDKDKNDVDRWYVADWIVKGETISGSTTSYKKIEDCTLDVNENEITYEDVKTVSIFCEEISSPVMGYYNGQFSNCEFNDTTGDAYLIEYDDEGYIKYFYNGNIVNGKEDDHTGKAWSISWGHNNTDYYFYRGNFTNGERDGELDSEKDKISNEKIISVIKDNIGSENSFAWRKTDTK